MGADYEGFKEWFTNHCYVCATLVDRIVPGFPRDTIKEIQQKVCYKDNLVVKAESFHLWVIEKAENMTVEQMQEEFPAHKAGLHVLITDNEKPYHERKVTLLNGPHTVLSPVTYLSGVNIVRDACEHPVLGKYIHKVQFEELMQTLNLPMDELVACGVDILAVQGTAAIRPDGSTSAQFIRAIKAKYPDQLLMADCDNFENAMLCAEAGADFVGTTMRGYTPETQGINDIDFEFVHKLAAECPAKIIAEGHIHYPEQAVKALEAGAFALVVGGAITRPAEITARFTGAINAMHK